VLAAAQQDEDAPHPVKVVAALDEMREDLARRAVKGVPLLEFPEEGQLLHAEDRVEDGRRQVD
jgi:hypothetical protein